MNRTTTALIPTAGREGERILVVGFWAVRAEWYKDVLDERRRLVAAGELKFLDWDTVRIHGKLCERYASSAFAFCFKRVNVNVWPNCVV